MQAGGGRWGVGCVRGGGGETASVLSASRKRVREQSQLENPGFASLTKGQFVISTELRANVQPPSKDDSLSLSCSGFI